MKARSGTKKIVFPSSPPPSLKLVRTEIINLPPPGQAATIQIPTVSAALPEQSSLETASPARGMRVNCNKAPRATRLGLAATIAKSSGVNVEPIVAIVRARAAVT